MGWAMRATLYRNRVSATVISGFVRHPAARAPVRTHARYAPANRCRRATYRFAKPQLLNSQWVFFAKPR